MQFLNNKNTLYDLLSQGAGIISPNKRLSEELLQHYFTRKCNSTLDKPYCMPYSQALEHAYNQLLYKSPKQTHPLLLNAAICQHLWRIILKSTPGLHFSEGLLKAVLEAWSHCEQWQIHPSHVSFNYTQQTVQFQHWRQQFNEHIDGLKAITEHQLVPYLIQTPISIFPQTLIWVCFDEFNPQQLHLQHHLTQQGVQQFHFDFTAMEDKPPLVSRFTANDKKEEYQQLIAWLHLRMQQGDQSIGVVVPNLQQEAQSLHRMLLKYFQPSCFNIYLGQTLREFHLVSHALTWLKLEQTLTPHEAALLLQSPYIAHAEEESLKRANFLQDSALLQEQCIPLESFIQELKPYSPKLALVLHSLKPFPKEASVHDWLDQFQARLQAIGFPGEAALHSENYQCFNRFASILDEFRQLSLISPRFSQENALQALTALTKNTIFQAQQIKAPIQISGLLEASGCEFDSLWVMGLTDGCLPQKTQLSAFIHPQLQGQLQMPHSSNARELIFAKKSLERLQWSSKHTVFSYPRHCQDTPNLPCALIIHYPPYVPLQPLQQPSNVLLIPLEERYCLPLNPDEISSAGTALLANQAKCPFKALAEHRLHAKPSLTPEDGLNARERGQIIHQIMEFLWKQLGSQATLIQLNSQDLDALVNQAIQQTLSPLKYLHPTSFPDLIEQVEHTRLKPVVLACLEWEKQRPPFEIAAIEQSYSISLANLKFKVRVDRLDKVGENKWVIDYKSTLPANKPWNEDRPKDPQLLLYALLDEDINALFFMQLKSGNLRFSGISEENHDIQGVSPIKKEEEWSQCKTHWHAQLSALAQEFQQGHCSPQPANSSICQLCDFQNLCRFQKDSTP